MEGQALCALAHRLFFEMLVFLVDHAELGVRGFLRILVVQVLEAEVLFDLLQLLFVYQLLVYSFGSR